MLQDIWKRWQALQERKQSMLWMAKRQDDKWLEDIGLKRDDLREMLDDWQN